MKTPREIIFREDLKYLLRSVTDAFLKKKRVLSPKIRAVRGGRGLFNTFEKHKKLPVSKQAHWKLLSKFVQVLWTGYLGKQVCSGFVSLEHRGGKDVKIVSASCPWPQNLNTRIRSPWATLRRGVRLHSTLLVLGLGARDSILIPIIK